MERVHCVRHKENTPSLVIYDTYAYCYGGCGMIPLEELGLKAKDAPKPRYKEDLETRRRYIETLPKKAIRGLMLPYDDLGYYIVWPDSAYYKLRKWEGEPKYKCPSGHAQPLFIARQLPSSRLFLVEGELNALSVSEAFPESSVVSPGSASDFLSERVKNDLKTYVNYSTLNVLVDRDGPGTAAAIEAKALLMHRAQVNIVLMHEDANEILVTRGKDALKEEVEKRLQEGL